MISLGSMPTIIQEHLSEIQKGGTQRLILHQGLILRNES